MSSAATSIEIPVELEFHPIANAFRLMNKAESDSLRADIKAHGLYEPVWLYEGKILDGRNRYLACVDLGIPVSIRNYVGENAPEFSLSMNKERRHCTPSQLAVAAVNLLPLEAEEARKRQQFHGGTAPGKSLPPNRGEVIKGESVDRVAQMVGVGATTVSKVARIKREHPERVKEIEDGHKTANAVYIELFPDSNPPAPTVPSDKPVSASNFENIRGYKEHRVTALQAIEKLLRDTEPVFRFGFWPVVKAEINTIDPAKAAELHKRAANCRQQFSQLIQLLKGRAP